MSRFLPHTRQFLALTLAAGAPAGLILFRMAYTHTILYGFLLWNLLLAWLPLLFAWMATLAYARGRARERGAWGHWLLALTSALAWLIFLPNAPYLITDIAHLRPFDHIPYFYDVTMLFSLALTGLMLGFASLAWMQEVVRERWGRWPARGFAVSVIALASFGVYLGRFLRWNSWDILIQPNALFRQLLDILHNPLTHRTIWAHVAILTVTLLVAYGMMTLLPAILSSPIQDRRTP